MKKIIATLLAMIMAFSLTIITSAQSSGNTSVLEELANGVAQNTYQIDISAYNVKVEDLQDLVDELTFKYPQLFNISGRYSYSYDSNTNIVFYIRFEYIMTENEYERALLLYNKFIEKIISQIPEDASDLEKVLDVHEYIIANYDYDTDYEIYDAYNFFKYKKGVCEGYTKAFTAIMNRLGIFTTTAFHFVSDYSPDNHCWNIVRLDGEYYHIDLTHDDSGSFYLGMGDRDFFLMSTEGMKASDLLHDTDDDPDNNTHSFWYTLDGEYVCDSTIYEKRFWHEYHHPSALLEGKLYQIIVGETIYDEEKQELDSELTLQTISPDGKTEMIANLNLPVWLTENSDGYTDGFFEIFAVGNDLYGISGKHLWKYNFNDKSVEIVDRLHENIIGATYAGGGRIKLLMVDSMDNYFEDTETYYLDYFQLTLGDSNGDGAVNAFDLLNIKDYLLNDETEYNYELMDMNADGVLDILDYICVKRHLAGLTA